MPHWFTIYLYECEDRHGHLMAGRRAVTVRMPPCSPRRKRERCYEEAEKRARRSVVPEEHRADYIYDPDNPGFCGYNIAWEGEIEV